MKHVASKDGTPIAYEQRGSGPALLLVHGTGIDHTYWSDVVARLERYFTVYVLDRRGRGQSGDKQPYAVEREFEDVAALVDAVGGEVNVVGHSYGALCCLEAALLTGKIRKLVLYEPPVYTTVKIPYPPDAFERFDAYVKAGEAEKALMMVNEIGHAPAREVELQRSLPNWQVRLDVVWTLRREVIGAMNYKFKADRFRDLKTAILLLVGGESTPFYKAATETLHKALPYSRVAVLSGQGHEAVVTSPELFLREVLAFLGKFNAVGFF